MVCGDQNGAIMFEIWERNLEGRTQPRKPAGNPKPGGSPGLQVYRTRRVISAPTVANKRLGSQAASQPGNWPFIPNARLTCWRMK